MTVVDVSVPVLEWAHRRSGRGDAELRKKFRRWDEWVAQQRKPSFSEVEKLAKFTRVPLGYFFLPTPPDEQLPIPDFRVGRGEQLEPSAELLETIFLNQRRQAWYEDYLAELGGAEPLAFVGSVRGMGVAEAAESITDALDYGMSTRATLRTADAARSYLMEAFEGLGGLVVINGMVENNTHRPLDADEFAGFTLHSAIAPLVFVNGRDTKTRQVFSLLHEFAHVWRGESGVSVGADLLRGQETEVERWCDQVAAAIAVPLDDLKASFRPNAEFTAELDRLAGRYLCSTLVVLLRLREAGMLQVRGFDEIYRAEVERLLQIMAERPEPSSGGNFYSNQRFRVGRTLGQAIVRDTKARNTPMTEALRLLSFSSTAVFDKYAENVGVR